MPNERLLRLILVTVVAAIHLVLIFFMVFNMHTISQEEFENARIMKVTDLEEEPPPPPPPPEEDEIPQVEAVAENMIETETVPLQTIVAHGTITSSAPPSWDEYLPMGKISEPPKFDEREIMASLVYPPIAQRSAIEGRVILELFVDLNGIVPRITVLLEDPTDRGFGDAAVNAFTGKRGVPAKANGEPVSARYRYPVSFKIK
jgi:TonB family protein